MPWPRLLPKNVWLAPGKPGAGGWSFSGVARPICENLVSENSGSVFNADINRFKAHVRKTLTAMFLAPWLVTAVAVVGSLTGSYRPSFPIAVRAPWRVHPHCWSPLRALPCARGLQFAGHPRQWVGRVFPARRGWRHSAGLPCCQRAALQAGCKNLRRAIGVRAIGVRLQFLLLAVSTAQGPMATAPSSPAAGRAPARTRACCA